MRWFVCLSLACVQVAEATPFRVESRTLEWTREALKNRSAGPGGTVEMPWVVSSNSKLAARINESLYLEILGVPPPRTSSKTFTLPRGLTLQSTHEVSFVTSRNDERILAIEVSREACGAYCEGDRRDFSFDARTGRALHIEDLLTSQGMKQLGNAMTAERKRRYTAELAALKKTFAARASASLSKDSASAESPDNEDDLEARIQLNQECLEREEDETNAVERELRIRWAHFSVPKSGAMILVSARCSNHAMRALDDVGDVALTVPSAQLAALLTAYGRAVVLGRGSGTEKSFWGQVLHGYIGKSPVTFRLEMPDDDGSTQGLYYYDRYRMPIEIQGRKHDTRLELTEEGAHARASFDLSPRADGLVGRWCEGDRELPVKLVW